MFDFTEDEMTKLVESVDKQFGVSVTGMHVGTGCHIEGFGEIADEWGGIYPQVIVIAACEGFRLLALSFKAAAEAGSLSTVMDPMDPDGAITAIRVDEETVGGFSDDEVTVDSLAAFIQTGISLAPEVGEIIAHVMSEGPLMAVEFIHAVIHAVANLLNDTKGVDYSMLSSFDINPGRLVAGWN